MLEEDQRSSRWVTETPIGKAHLPGMYKLCGSGLGTLWHQWCKFCLQSGGDRLVRCFQDDVSNLVRMREKRDMAGRDLARSCLAPLRHPTVLIGMDHSILETKQRP